MIRIDNVCKQYGAVMALDHVNMTVEEGDLVAILGPNGAGKSTFLNILSTSKLPTSGEIVYSGKTMPEDAVAIRGELGVVFQDTILDGELTALQNLMIHAELYGVDKNVKDVCMDSLKFVGLDEDANKRVDAYSGGMKRKLELAKCLIHHPKIIILDEPTTGLDVQTRRTIWQVIKRLNAEEKVTVFLATHYIEEANICDTVYILNHGKIVESGSVSSLLKKYSSSRAYIKIEEEDREKLNGLNVTAKDSGFYEVSSEQSVSQLLEEIYARQIRVKDIMIEPSSLEDAYLKITGGNLNEEQFTEVK